MKTIKMRIIGIAITLLFSCQSAPEYIIPVDFEKYQQEYVPGLTQKDANTIQLRQWEEVLENSLGKEIPDIQIKNQEGDNIKLKNNITQQTLIVMTDAHCSWGIEGLTNDLPKVLEKLHENQINPNIICLLIKEAQDDENPTQFMMSMNELKKEYSDVYIIDKIDAKRLNVFANPTRIITNKNHIVTHMGLGVSSPERLYDELETHLLD